MFAVLPTIMDLSAGCRPSQSMSPARHPPIASPPALIPLGKIEREFIKTEKNDPFPQQNEPPSHKTPSHVSSSEKTAVEPEHSQVASSIYQPGECGIGAEEQNVNYVTREIHDRELYAPSHHTAQPSYPTIEPNLSIPQNFSLQQISVLSQQMIAAMLSLQRLQQSNAAAATLGNLLPPPPNLGSAIGYQTPSPQNIAFSPDSGSTVHRPGVSSTSNQSLASQSFNGSSSDCQENELPLDLSKPNKGLVQNQTSMPSTNKRQYDPTSLASIRSNFPTLLSNKASNAKKRKSPPPLINSLPSSSTPVIHRTANSWTTSQSSSETNNQLVSSQMQLQNWLLAAMSVQKMQQIALGRSVLLQESQSNQDLTNIAPRKRKLDQTYQGSNDNRTQQNQNMSENGEPPQLPKARKTPPFLHASGRTSESPSTKSTASISPASDHAQPGKRYRRYAKPPYSYVSLITLAILSSRDKKLRLSQILKRISEMFPFFNGTYQGWRDSVRHNLSQNECFVKVLKNPYRPTAKGNFWTVNLNSIPHELLLRQNTLVSRYAQDSGYRYRKDLTEVFNLRTGALKVPVPRHLLKNAEHPEMSMLCEDPAAVMEAILLEETDEDEMNSYNDKISPELRQFTLEDLFNQGDDYDDESLQQSGRSRGRTRQKAATVITHLPQMTSQRMAFPESQYALQNCSTSQGDNSSSYPFHLILPKDSASKELLYTSLANENANPFAARQTAVLAKALSSQMPGFRLPSLVIPDGNAQLITRQQQEETHEASSGSERARPSSPSINNHPLDNTMERSDDLSPSVKKSKRKGQPTRHSESIEGAYSSESYEKLAEMSYPTSTHETNSISFSLPYTKPQSTHVAIAANLKAEDTTSILFQPPHAVDSSLQTSHI